MANLDKIEAEWKAAVQIGKIWMPTTVEIALHHKVSEAYIRKVAKKFGWQRGAALTPLKLPPPPRELMRRDASDAQPAKADDLLQRMLDELDTVTSHIGELEELIELETGGDRDDRRRAAMMKAVSLPVRANTLKLLLMAQADAAPEGKKGKKEQLLEKAKGASGGKFGASAAPGLRAVT